MTQSDWDFINNVEDSNLDKSFNSLTRKYVDQAFDKKLSPAGLRKLYLLQDRLVSEDWMAKLTLDEKDPDKQLMARFKTVYYLLDNTGMIEDYYRLFGRDESQQRKLYSAIAKVMKIQIDRNKQNEEKNSIHNFLSRITKAITGKSFYSRQINKEINKGGNYNARGDQEK